MATPGIGEQDVGQIADENPGRRRPSERNHPGSFSYLMYWPLLYGLKHE